ncbi:MAG: hypothetical protein GY946_00135 [bacterium]|nr:hypothetical protein [bacterium]
MVLLGALASLVTMATALASDSGEVREAQLEYAKEMYGQGIDALERGDPAAAVAAFEEAYRYAPDRHVFNFNIGAAAIEADDCGRAMAAFESFLSLVPEHPERRTAAEHVVALRQTGCSPKIDVEMELELEPDEPAPPVSDDDSPISGHGVVTSQGRNERSVLYPALKELREAVAFYERTAESHKKARGFRRVIKKKKVDVEDMELLIKGLGHPVPAPEDLPKGAKQGDRRVCARAARRESRQFRAFEDAADVVTRAGDREALVRMALRAGQRHRKFFERCAR